MKKIYKFIIIFLILYICFLCSNPWTLEMNKYKVYSYIEPKFKLKTMLYEYEELKTINEFPIIIKPNIYSRLSTDTSKISNKIELEEYIKRIKNNQNYIVQEFYPSKYEVGVLYEKNPLNKKGKIISIVLKQKYNDVWKPLSCVNILKKENVCVNKDRSDLITKELNETIEYISSKVPSFYTGRYDIGFDNIEDFKKGKNFKIFELNGNGSIDLRMSITELEFNKNNFYKFFYILRFIFSRMLFGFINLTIHKKKCTQILLETKERFEMIFNENELSWLITPSFA